MNFFQEICQILPEKYMFDRLCVIKFFFISFGLDGMKKILALLKDNDMRESKPSNQQGSSIEGLPNSKSLNCAGGVEKSEKSAGCWCCWP